MRYLFIESATSSSVWAMRNTRNKTQIKEQLILKSMIKQEQNDFLNK